VKDSDYADGLLVYQEIETDGLETGYRPGPEILKFRVAQTIRGRRAGLLAYSPSGFPDGFFKTDGNIRNILQDQVVTELARHVIARRLAIGNFHSRGLGL